MGYNFIGEAKMALSKLNKKYKNLFLKNKKRRAREDFAKKLLIGGGLAWLFLGALSLKGVFMPKKSKGNQELSSKLLIKKKAELYEMKQVAINAHDGLQIKATIFEAKNPKALVQLVHGALEHKARYYPLMSFLAKNGYTCIISDNRGHGYSIDKNNPLGYMNGMDQLVDDLYRVSLYAKRSYPGLKLNMVGHSLGSMLARDYLQLHDDEIEKLVLSGTPNFHPFTRLGIHLGKFLLLHLGPDRHSRVFNNIKPGKDWLSHNKTNIKKAEEDPLMFASYPNISGYTIWEINWNLKQFKKYNFKNPDLKILNMVGAEDQKITGGAKGIKDSLNSLRRIGYTEIESREYQGMKHEVFNENNKMTVYQDLLNFLNS